MQNLLAPLIQPIALTVSSLTSLQDAIAQMDRQSLDTLLVWQGEKLEGFLTQRDIIRACAQSLDLTQTPVEQVMRSPVIVVSANASVDEVYQIMQAEQVTLVVVVNHADERLGVVSLKDVLATLDPVGMRRELEAMRQCSQAHQRQSHLETLKRQRLEAEYAELLDAIPYGVCISTFETGHFLLVNDAFCSLSGYSGGELQGKTYKQLNLWLDPIERQNLVATLQEQSTISLKAQLRTKANQIKAMALSISLIHIHGKPHLLTVMQDVSDRQLIEEALRSSEARTRAILTAIPDLLLLLGHDGTYLEIVRQSDSLYNLLDQLPLHFNPFGQRVSDMLPTQVADRLMEALNHAIATGNVQSYEQRIIVRGRTQHEDIRVSPIDDHTVLVMIRDISDRKRSEARQQAAEAALRESEARFQEIAHTIDQKFFVRSATTGQFLYVSPAYEKIWGRSCHSLYRNPQSWMEAIHPDDWAAINASVERQFQGQGFDASDTLTREFRIIRPDGEQRWIFAQISLVRDALGHPARFIGLAADITKRKQLELTLQASEAKLSDILDQAIAAIACFRVFPDKSWQQDYYSAGAQKIYGYTADELMGDRSLWISRVHPDDRVRLILPLFDDFIAGRSPQVHYRFYKKDGTLCWLASQYTCRYDETNRCWLVTAVDIDISASMLAKQTAKTGIDRQAQTLHGASGKHSCSVEPALDIPPSQLTELALRNSQQRYVRATLAAKVGVWEWDVVTNEMYIDPTLKALLGYRDEDIRNHLDDWGSYVYECDRPLVAVAIEQCLQHETSIFRVEHRMRHKDGSLRWMLAQGEVLHDDAGEAERIIGTDTDITERKQLELSLKASEAKLSEVLNSIRASVGYFRRYPDGTWVADYHSRGSELIFGYLPEEFTAELWLQGIITSDWEKLDRQITEAIEACQSLTVEYRFQRPDGIVCWISDTLNSHWDENSQCWNVTIIGMDVSDRKVIEIALRNSEQQFRAVFNSAFQFMGLFTTAGIYIDVNDTTLEFTGCSRSDVVGLSVWDSPWFIPFPAAQAQLRESMAEAAQGKLVRLEIPALSRWGTVAEIDVSFKPLVDQQGNCYQILGEGRDITDLKRTAHHLEHQRNFLQQVINAIPSGVYVKDPNGRYLVVNQATANMYGRLVADLLGKRDIDFGADPNQWAQFQINNRQVMERRRSQVNTDEYICNHKGEGRWYQTTISPFIDSKGRVEGIIGASIDISDRKQLELALQTSEAQLNDILNSVGASVVCAQVFSDRTLRITYRSLGCALMTGYSLDELSNELYLSRILPEDLAAAQNAVMDIAFSESSGTVEYRFLHKQGYIRWISETFTSRRDDANDCWVITGVGVDISDRKAAEAQLRRSLDEKSVLVAEIHHRVKNNLQVIDSLLSLQALRISDESARAALANSGDRIRSMAIVHEKLYQTNIGEGIRLDDYLQELIQNISLSVHLEDTGVVLNSALDSSIILNLDQAIPCGLIFNEMLTNAFKHGLSSNRSPLAAPPQPADNELASQANLTPKSATIEIHLTQQTQARSQMVWLRVGNPGNTLPSNFSLKSPNDTMGLQLMQVLASQIGGHISFERGDTTWFCLSFENAISQGLGSSVS